MGSWPTNASGKNECSECDFVNPLSVHDNGKVVSGDGKLKRRESIMRKSRGLSKKPREKRKKAFTRRLHVTASVFISLLSA